MSAAYRCETCEGEPLWRIERWGDAVVSWACAVHLCIVCEGLQRDWEITQLSVYPAAKRTEWAQLGHRLNQIAEEAS
jgi:hypothetical protein